MSEDTLTKADIDKAVKEALASAREEFDAEVAGLKDKNKELLGKLRAAGEIKPEDLAAAEDRAEKAEAKAKELEGSVKALTKERDNAVKALETESAAARTYALDAELAGAIAEGNVIPSLVPGFKAMMASQAKADLVDGKYAVTIGDKAAREHIKAFLDSEDGKAWRAAQQNGGGGAPGSQGGGAGTRTITKAEYQSTIDSGDMKAISAMNQGIRAKEIVVQDNAA